MLPDVVVLASSVEDVVEVLRCAEETGVPVTPRCGGTGKSGGAVPVCGGIVLSTLGMNKIKEVDRRDRVVVAEPGVVLEHLQDAVEAEGLFYPPDPNSQSSCGIGGNIAENAGGPRAFKYGVTGDYVLGLEAVTIGGGLIRTGTRTIKGVVGYDMTSLLVGSEGTLAVVTEATLRLLRKPACVHTLLSYFSGAVEAGKAVTSIIDARVIPRCVEFLDQESLVALRNSGVGVDGRAGAMLLVEVDGDDGDCERQLELVGECCVGVGALDVVVAQGEAQRDRLWGARRELSSVIRRLARHKLSEDVVVPAGRIPELLWKIEKIREAKGVRVLSYGHAGDGNLHVNFLWDEEFEAELVELAVESLFVEVLGLGGTISGEHGIGVMKARYLRMEQGELLIGLQRGVKASFDVRGLLNPGKIFMDCGLL